MLRRALGPISNLPTPLLPPCLPPCAVICWSNPLSRATSSQILWEVKGHTNCELFSEVTRTRAFYSFLNLEQTELGDVVFPCRTRDIDFLSQKKKKEEDGQQKADQSGPSADDSNKNARIKKKNLLDRLCFHCIRMGVATHTSQPSACVSVA